MIHRARTFPNGGSQALRLPKEVHVDGDEVCLWRRGAALLIYPSDQAPELLECAAARRDDVPSAGHDRTGQSAVVAPAPAIRMAKVFRNGNGQAIRVELERGGTSIGPLGTLIAAHALSVGATVVTSNEREFRRVPGLTVENWLADERR